MPVFRNLLVNLQAISRHFQKKCTIKEEVELTPQNVLCNKPYQNNFKTELKFAIDFNIYLG